MTGFLSGTATALPTPLSESGVKETVLSQMIEFQIAAGVSAVVVLGTTGEPSTMSEREKETAVRCAVETAAGRIKVIVGTGCNCTERAVKDSRRAQALGADAVLAVTPYYNKCTQRGLVLYYSAIAAAVDVPVILYNVPSRTGVNLLPETASELAALPSIAGIKEASGNMAQILETAALIRGRCDIYSGDDALNLPILAAGGSAVISVVSNLVPARVCKLCNAVKSSDLALANRLNDRLLPLVKACFCEVNPIPVKAGLELLGFDAGLPRPPLTPLDGGKRERLYQTLLSCMEAI